MPAHPVLKALNPIMRLFASTLCCAGRGKSLGLISTYKRIKQISRFDQPRYDEGGVVLALSSQDLVLRLLDYFWSLMWFNNLYQ